MVATAFTDATASPDGEPHLIPLSLHWDDGTVVMITPTDSPTVRNARATGHARVSLADPDDVVVMRGAIEAVPLDDVDPDLIDRFVERAGWRPSPAEGPWSVLLVTPRLVHAWHGIQEFDGRTIMREGTWAG